MKCDKCGSEMDAAGTTQEFPDCNTWTCTSCGFVQPEGGSARLMTITREQFIRATGEEPVQDDLERSNCTHSGEPGHFMCGWCDSHDKPRHICGCINLGERQ